jgi:hypothetical protein
VTATRCINRHQILQCVPVDREKALLLVLDVGCQSSSSRSTAWDTQCATMHLGRHADHSSTWIEQHRCKRLHATHASSLSTPSHDTAVSSTRTSTASPMTALNASCHSETSVNRIIRFNLTSLMRYLFRYHVEAGSRRWLLRALALSAPWNNLAHGNLVRINLRYDSSTALGCT